MNNFKDELKTQCDEVAFGLASLGQTYFDSETDVAHCQVGTLDGNLLRITMDQTGVQATYLDDKQNSKQQPENQSQKFDSVNTLLINLSPKFRRTFQAQLIAGLNSIAQERSNT